MATPVTTILTAGAGLSLTSSPFTPTAGHILVVKGVSEDSVLASPLGTTDSQSNTYTQQAVDGTHSHCEVALWTAVVGASTSMTVTMTQGGTAGRHFSFVVEEWSSAAIAATPATALSVSSGAPTASLTTTAPSSWVSWLNGDWSASNPTGRTYNTTSATPTDEGVDDQSPALYVGYFARQPAASATSVTIGMTAPAAQAYSVIGIEVLDTSGGGAAEDPDQFGRFPWQ